MNVNALSATLADIMSTSNIFSFRKNALGHEGYTFLNLEITLVFDDPLFSRPKNWVVYGLYN